MGLQEGSLGLGTIASAAIINLKQGPALRWEDMGAPVFPWDGAVEGKWLATHMGLASARVRAVPSLALFVLGKYSLSSASRSGLTSSFLTGWASQEAGIP